MKKLFAFLVTCFLLPLTVNAQRGSQPVNRPAKVKRSVRRYWDFAHEIEQKVWNMDLPQFKIDTLPAKYRDADAVVLAEYDSVEYRRTPKVSPMGCVPIFLVTRTIHVSSLHRTRIFINSEQAARDNSCIPYSRKYDFTTNSFVFGPSYRSTMGIRIIKPNGRIITIDTMPTISPASLRIYNEPDTIDTIRIHQLEKGDILDIFRYNKHTPETNPYCLSFNKKYPILHYDCRIKTNKRWNNQYRLTNGFPDFKWQKTGNKKDLLLSASLNDFSNNMDSVPQAYYYIRVKNRMNQQKLSHKAGIMYNPPIDAILDDSHYEYICSKRDYHSDRREIYHGEDSLRHFSIIDSIINLNITDRQKADSLYKYICRGNIKYQKSWSFRTPTRKLIYTDVDFCDILSCALISAGIPFDYAYTTEHDKEPVDKLMDASNLITFIRLKDGTLYFPKHGTQVNEVPEDLRGRKAVLADWSEFFTLPKE